MLYRRWESPEDPDPNASQRKTIREFLNSKEGMNIKYVFFECVFNTLHARTYLIVSCYAHCLQLDIDAPKAT